MVLHPSTSSQVSVPIMIFIDGGYLRTWLKTELNEDIENFDLGMFSVDLAKNMEYPSQEFFIIRTYFYDGIVAPEEREYEKQSKVHNNIEKTFANYEVRQGQLVKDGNGKFRQKGVDALLALDMLEKATTNQYKVAILVAGDLDHLEVVKMVKNKGKQVYGIYDPRNTSEKF